MTPPRKRLPRMTIEISERDWTAIRMLIDTLEDYTEQFEGPNSAYKKDWKHYHDKVLPKIRKQLAKAQVRKLTKLFTRETVLKP